MLFNLNSFPHMAMKIKLSTLLSTLSAHPEVEEHLDIDGYFKFIELIQLLKPTLSLHQPPGTEEHIPLTSLPLAVLDFFKVCLNLEHESAKLIWEALCPIAWGLGAPSDMQAFGRRYLHHFLDHGRSLGLGTYICDYFIINLSDPLFLQHSFTLCCLSAHVSIPAVIQNLEWPNQQVYHTLGNLLKAIFSM